MLDDEPEWPEHPEAVAWLALDENGNWHISTFNTDLGEILDVLVATARQEHPIN